MTASAPRQRTPRPSDGPSLSEIGRILEALRGDTETRLDRIEGKFDKLDHTYVRRDLYDAEMRANTAQVEGYRERLAKLEDANQWLVRLVGGTIITAVLGGLFTASRFVGGP